eukprot:Gb_32640 [translate_table: standard]
MVIAPKATIAPQRLDNPGLEWKIRNPPRRMMQVLNCPSTTCVVAEVAPSAKAPDHCSKNPSVAEIIMANELERFQLNASKPGGSNHGIKTTKEKTVMGVVFHINASAVQLSCCWRFDHKILFTALGIIHAMAIKAPNRLNCKSVTVATATPIETTSNASAF